MVVRKEDIHNLIERLQDDDQKTVLDFLQYLIDRPKNKKNVWTEIDQAKSDDEPLSEEELRQLNSDAGFVTGEKLSVSSDYKLIYRNLIKFF